MFNYLKFVGIGQGLTPLILKMIKRSMLAIAFVIFLMFAISTSMTNSEILGIFIVYLHAVHLVYSFVFKKDMFFGYGGHLQESIKYHNSLRFIFFLVGLFGIALMLATLAGSGVAAWNFPQSRWLNEL